MRKILSLAGALALALAAAACGSVITPVTSTNKVQAPLDVTAGPLGGAVLHVDNKTGIYIQAPTVIDGGFTLGTKGTQLHGLAHYSASLAPAALGANACADTYFDAGGAGSLLGLANVGDECMTGDLPSQTANVNVRCRVVATGVVMMRFCNPSAGTPTPVAGNYSIAVLDP